MSSPHRCKGKTINLQPDSKCIIAHPVHLFGSGEWSAFQTAEIISKIVLLAEDNKIKDSTVLEQFKKG